MGTDNHVTVVYPLETDKVYVFRFQEVAYCFCGEGICCGCYCIRTMREDGTDWKGFESEIQSVEDVGVIEKGFSCDIFG